jgi:MFS family permease
MSDGFVTVAQCVEGLPLGRFVWELLACAMLFWFLLGCINECTPVAFSFVQSDWPSEQSTMMLSGALVMGNFMAILLAGWIADRFGRMAVVRPALLATIMCGTLLQLAHTFAQAMVSRLVLGFVSGGILGVLPPLVAELLPSRNRGFHMTIWCAGWPAGAMFALIAGCLFDGPNSRAFHTLILMSAIVLYMCTRADLIPESPRYLYMVGRRDEGYSVLMDMYDKEQLPMPWAADTIAVTCASTPGERAGAPADASSSSCQTKPAVASSAAVTALLALAMFLVSAAGQSMKLIVPVVLVAHQGDALHSARVPVDAAAFLSAYRRANIADPVANFGPFAGYHGSSLLDLALGRSIPHPHHKVHAHAFEHRGHGFHEVNYNIVFVLAQAYIVQTIGVVLCAYMSTWVYRKSMIQWSLLCAAFFTLATMVAAEHGALLLCGPFLGVQLAAQSAAFNFLQVFACEYFPTSTRAKMVAVVNFSAQLGNIVLPVFGDIVMQKMSTAGAVVFFGLLYVACYFVSSRLPLQNVREQPLHDVEAERSQKSASVRSRKREWASYQTI